jgi:hypothetical protein
MLSLFFKLVSPTDFSFFVQLWIFPSVEEEKSESEE